MRSITIDINPELTVYFHKIRGKWKLGWSGTDCFKTKTKVLKDVAAQIKRVKAEKKKRLEDLEYVQTLLRAKK